MHPKQSKSFSFPVKDFKHISTPLEDRGYKDYLCVVDVMDLPDLSEWGKSNLRDPKASGKVPQMIKDGLLDEDLFVYMNRGLVLVADAVDFDNKRNRVTLTFTDPEIHGLIDGGHTHLIINMQREALAQKQDEMNGELHRFVKVEVLKGFDRGEIKDIAGARNTSNQVKDESLLQLEGRFDNLSKALDNESYFGDIAFKEYETYPGTEEPKSIDIRDIIAVLYMFDVETFQGQKHPINGYRSKMACLKEFKSRTEDGSASIYDKLYPLMPDILRLHDEIHVLLPDLYNKSRAEFGEDVKSGKFGRLTGVVSKQSIPLPFSGKTAEYRIPAGFVFPILGALRALVEERGGRYQWIRGCDPFRLLRGDMGLRLADAVGSTARKDQNPSKTGKDISLWQSCYQAAIIARQAIEIEYLKKDSGKASR